MPVTGRLADLTLPIRSLATSAWARARLGADQRSGASLTRVAGLSLTSCFGDRMSSGAILRLARRCAVQHALRHLDHRDLIRDGRARVIHRRPLDRLRDRGQGAMVVSIHLGPYRYVASELLHLGFRVVVIVDDVAIDREGAFWENGALRTRGRLELLPVLGAGGLLRALRALDQGAMVVVYMDGGTGVGGPAARGSHEIVLSLGSMPVRMRTGAAHIAQRAGATTLLAAAHRDRWGRRSVEFSDEVAPPPRDDPAGAERQVREITPWFERRIFARPEEWVGWFFPMFAWPSTGAAPTASREQLSRTRERVRALLANPASTARLSADAVRVGAVEKDEHRVLVDGARRLVLDATPLGLEVMRAAQRRTRFSELSIRTGGESSELEMEVSRMVLAGLAEIEEPD
ncbi:MAG TPA: hypothetical protein VL123_04080 [Candidatus Udaeobacter sp.]|jgi:lauroyl/myristoyl acyltransferase|nr:hypothetical protein [Candidatus Udaeobacter sp.]